MKRRRATFSARRSLLQGLGAIQVKYATGELERLGLPAELGATTDITAEQPKLFVGSLPKAFEEEDVRALFAPYGEIAEVFIMRDQNKVPKGRFKIKSFSCSLVMPPKRLARSQVFLFPGCAFLKFSSKDAALMAIQNCNGKITPEGGVRPVEVRFGELVDRE